VPLKTALSEYLVREKWSRAGNYCREGVPQAVCGDFCRPLLVSQKYGCAAETARMTRMQIGQQAATAMLAQANQLPNVILALLQ
jgi:hypothetical protein